VLRMSTSLFGFLHGGAVLPLVVLAFSVGGSARSFGRYNPGTPIGVERDSRPRVLQRQAEGVRVGASLYQAICKVVHLHSKSPDLEMFERTKSVLILD
jgi:hypothetical protein